MGRKGKGGAFAIRIAKGSIALWVSIARRGAPRVLVGFLRWMLKGRSEKEGCH